MLPKLRQELILYPGPTQRSGEPSWLLQDPQRNQYFELDWLSFEILARWHLSNVAQIVQNIIAETTLTPTTDDVEMVLQFLADNALIEVREAHGVQRLQEQKQRMSTKLSHWIVHRYLFFRIPLLKPDAWLNRTQRWVSLFYSIQFRVLTLLALGLGVFGISRQWDGFVASLVDFFSWQGLFSFFLALVFVKFMHELGHAYTAKRYGCRVPTMGIAFLLLFPMPYTDVTDVWKLRKRNERLWVGSSGVSTELHIAAWASLLWVVLPPGALRDAAFILATTTWVTTVLINVSPFLRFDGYFLLMDWLGLSNLHQRSFELGKWHLRAHLFGLKETPPELFPEKRMRGLILFAYATWTYRFVIFLGIAILVYTYFPKPLGPILAIIELWWFIGRPMFRELKEWRQRGAQILQRRRVFWLAAGLLGLLLVASVPWDTRVQAKGVMRPAVQFPLVPPDAAQIIVMPAAHGSELQAGAVILELYSPDLNLQRDLVMVRSETLRWQNVAAGVDEELLEQRMRLEAELARSGAELVWALEEESRLKLVAPNDGVVFWHDLDLKPGDWVGRNALLGHLVDRSDWHIVTYLSESDLGRVQLGDRARFMPDAGGASYPLTVNRIDYDATRSLTDGLLSLANGGHIATRETGAGLVPENAVYRVLLRAEHHANEPAQFAKRGRIVIHGQAQSWLGRYAQNVAAIIVRESGF